MIHNHGRPDHRSGLVRSGPWSGFLVRDFIRSGPWSGFWSGILVGPVRGPDFGPELYLVRYVVRNSVRKSAPGRIIRTGPDFGPDFKNNEKIKNFESDRIF